MPKTTTAADTSIESKLDVIIEYLDRMDRRDRNRTIAGAIRSVISLFWIVLLLWSSWYFIAHWGDIMKQITTQAAASAAQYTQQKGTGLLDQLTNQYSFPGKQQ